MVKEAIDSYFETHRRDYLDHLAALIAVDSSRSEELPGMPYGRGAAEVLEKTLKLANDFGLYTENWDNRLGIIQLRPGNERLLDIFAHLDVVPAGEGWTATEPFVMKEDNGMIYGRGVIDDKGPALAAIYSLRAIKELGIKMKDNVRIMVGCDEECGGSELKYYFMRTKAAPMTFTPDGNFPVVNTEKGRYCGHFCGTFTPVKLLPRLISLNAGLKDNVIPSSAEAVVKGMSMADLVPLMDSEGKVTGVEFTAVPKENDEIVITAQGVGGHASIPQRCNNALTAMLQLISRLPLQESEGNRLLRELAGLFPHGDYYGRNAGIFMEDKASGTITVSLNLLHMSEETLNATFDARIPVCADRENLKPISEKAMAAGFTFTDDLSMTHHVPEDSYFVRVLLKNYEKYFCKPGKGVAIGGGTYVHSIENGVAFGCMEPGVDYHVHGADEFVPVELLLTSGKIFAGTMIDLCGGGSREADQ